MTFPQLNFVTTCAFVNINYRRGCPLYALADCFFVRNQKLTYFLDHRRYWYALILSRSSPWCHIHDGGGTRKWHRGRGERSLFFVLSPQFRRKDKRTPFFTDEIGSSHQDTYIRSMQPSIRSEISRRVKIWSTIIRPGGRLEYNKVLTLSILIDFLDEWWKTKINFFKVTLVRSPAQNHYYLHILTMSLDLSPSLFFSQSYVGLP